MLTGYDISISPPPNTTSPGLPPETIRSVVTLIQGNVLKICHKPPDSRRHSNSIISNSTLLTGMVLRSHICDHIFSSFLLDAGSREISRISQCSATFWKALRIGHKTHPLALIEACVKKDLNAIESQGTLLLFSLAEFIEYCIVL